MLLALLLVFVFLGVATVAVAIAVAVVIAVATVTVAAVGGGGAVEKDGHVGELLVLVVTLDHGQHVALHEVGTDNEDVQVFMLDKDIRAKGLNWCFGATHGKMILISDYRIRNTNYTKQAKVAMLSYLIEHEIGHAFHVADDLRAQGIYDLHCTDLCCVMQRVPSLKELADKAKFVTEYYHATEEDECFCPHCRRRFAYFVMH